MEIRSKKLDKNGTNKKMQRGTYYSWRTKISKVENMPHAIFSVILDLSLLTTLRLLIAMKFPKANYDCK